MHNYHTFGPDYGASLPKVPRFAQVCPKVLLFTLIFSIRQPDIRSNATIIKFSPHQRIQKL